MGGNNTEIGINDAELLPTISQCSPLLSVTVNHYSP